MNIVLAIAFGGGLGAVMRHYAVALVTAVMGQGFPYGVLLVNVLGSFLIGFLMELAALKWQAPLEVRAFLVTGVLGGFTTFSAFSFDVFRLAETGEYVSSIVYAASSVMLSIIAVFMAVYLVRGVLG